MVDNLFNMGVEYMKTSDLIAWNCKSFMYILSEGNVTFPVRVQLDICIF